MEKLKAVRNMLLIVGTMICFSTLGEDPVAHSLEVGSGLMFVGFLLEAVHAMKIW